MPHKMYIQRIPNDLFRPPSRAEATDYAGDLLLASTLRSQLASVLFGPHIKSVELWMFSPISIVTPSMTTVNRMYCRCFWQNDSTSDYSKSQSLFSTSWRVPIVLANPTTTILRRVIATAPSMQASCVCAHIHGETATVSLSATAFARSATRSVPWRFSFRE
jgi:hypothetical protein